MRYGLSDLTLRLHSAAPLFARTGLRSGNPWATRRRARLKRTSMLPLEMVIGQPRNECSARESYGGCLSLLCVLGTHCASMGSYCLD